MVSPAQASRGHEWFTPYDKSDVDAFIGWMGSDPSFADTHGRDPQSWLVRVRRGHGLWSVARWGSCVVRHGDYFEVFTAQQWTRLFVAPQQSGGGVTWAGSDRLFYRMDGIEVNGCPLVGNRQAAPGDEAWTPSAMSLAALLAIGVRFTPILPRDVTGARERPDPQARIAALEGSSDG